MTPNLPAVSARVIHTCARLVPVRSAARSESIQQEVVDGVLNVDEPPVRDRMAGRNGRVGEAWGQALDPPVDRHVINFDPSLGEEFFNITVGESVAQIPADREDDDLGRERNPAKADRSGMTGTERPRQHIRAPSSIARDLSTQQCPIGSSGATSGSCRIDCPDDALEELGGVVFASVGDSARNYRSVILAERSQWRYTSGHGPGRIGR